VIWVLVCATAGAAPHSSATATSAIAIRLSMLTMEQSRASTLGGARNKLRNQRRSWAPTLSFLIDWYRLEFIREEQTTTS
jgi:hypothetical protein